MLRDLTFRVSEQDAGSRADRFLTQRVATTDRALVRLAFEAKAVTRNGRSVTKGQTLKAGDLLVVACLYEKNDRRVTPEHNSAVKIIYEDNALVVFDKPPGMPVHPLRIGEIGTLANCMVALYPETAHIGPDPLFPALVHRIDGPTSGLVVAARTPDAYQQLRRQFQSHKVVKEYLAIVHGSPPSTCHLVHYLAHDPNQPGRMIASTRPSSQQRVRWMKAITDYRTERSFDGLAELRVTIRTGVTHQIRCQLAASGYPIAGDSIYGSAVTGKPCAAQRMFLHAAAIAFTHPETGRPVRFESDPPPEWLIPSESRS